MIKKFALILSVAILLSFALVACGESKPTPDTAKPDTTEPDTTVPDTTEPDATEPDTTVPDTTEPDTTESDTAEPDTAEPDTTVPEEISNRAGEEYDEFAQADKKYINKRSISYYAMTNEDYLVKPVTGIILEFPGLGGSSCLGGNVNMGEYSSPFAQNCGAKGIVVAYMYCGPWSWMNKGAVRMADLVVDAIVDKYQMPDDFTLVASGGSMGGLGALIYSADTKHKITACMAACPCYDVERSFLANPSFPRTYISAIYAYDMSLSDAIATISPIKRIDDMPSIPYYILCDVEDEVFDDEGMDEYVQLLKDKGHDVTYVRLPDQKHGGITPEARIDLNEFMLSNATGNHTAE